jgi:hypothetical protein
MNTVVKSALLGLALAGAGLAQAVMVGTVDGSRVDVLRTAPTVPGATAQSSQHTVASARIEAIDLARNQLKLRGQWVPVAVDKLQVFGRQGAAGVGLRALQTGMAIRFGLESETPHRVAGRQAAKAAATTARHASGAEPSASAASSARARRRIVLIYID